MSRKTTPVGSTTTTPASSPAGGQRSIQMMIQQEKEKMTSLEAIMLGIQKLQASTDEKLDTLVKRSETMEKKMETMEKQIVSIEQKTDKTEGKIQNIQNWMMKQEDRMQKIEEREEQREKKDEEFDSRLSDMEKESSGIIGWEMDRSEYFLRFQNIIEEKGENLLQIISEILTEVLELPQEKVRDGIDEAFRVNTRYATRNALPREVHVRFTKKALKLQILQKIRDRKLEYKNKEIVVLKQIPRRVREKRREYQFLTTILLKKGVNYRWLIPEGLIFLWKGQRYRIDTIEKAEAFYTEHLRGKTEKTGKEELLVQLLDVPRAETEKMEGAIGGIDIEEGAVGGIDTREQREPRSTRAIKPIYKT